MALTITPLLNFPLIKKGDDLTALIAASLEGNDIRLLSGDVLVLAQKIVSKAEGRLIKLEQVRITPQAEKLAILVDKDPRLVTLILQESRELLRAVPGVLIVEHRLGFVCANAGIDRSNIEEEDAALLLPEDPSASAAAIRLGLESHAKKQIAVMVIDSHGRAWREGVLGTCIGFSGLPGLVDLRGEPDMFGNTLRITRVAAADELAAAASLMMGQAGEGLPVVHVRGFPYPLEEGCFDEIIRDKEKDLFR
ncbi:MAG: coenzyme F420-0:L-glutamate ligase [Anaerolineales bacterium]|nr:coenzyme F420-0:L-glutamate ligase [Anaerolineales bacterium]